MFWEKKFVEVITLVISSSDIVPAVQPIDDPYSVAAKYMYLYKTGVPVHKACCRSPWVSMVASRICCCF